MTETQKTHTSPQGSADFLPGPVLLIGPPGVGKGTQSKILMAEFGIPQISTGDLFRQHRADHTDLGNLADKLMSEGKLVPDQLVNDMVAERLTHADCARGYILDGFPRTLPQANWLDAHLAGHTASAPVIVISMVVDREDLLKRITGRRTCPHGHIYNIYSHPPKVTNTCDLDGAQLAQRNDDTEATFQQRMREFDEKTAPVLPHYRDQGRFAEVDGLASVDTVTDAIRTQLKRLRAEAV